MTDWLQEAHSLAPEILSLREAIHRRPELGTHEIETSALAEKTLLRLGLEVRRPWGTAVTGLLRGALPGPVIALRADMDALPLTEETGAPFASQIPGVMHACGHDVHTAAALGAAMLLSARRDSLRGSFLFLFQPDEEGSGGARPMIEAGVLEGVDCVFGAHVSPALPEGCAGFRYGKFYAASDTFRISLHGRSCHGAERENGADALAAAADLTGRLLALPDRFTDRCVVTVGTLHAGTAVNILAGEASLSGILRTLGPDDRRAMRALVPETAAAVALHHGVSQETVLNESYPGVVNHDDAAALAERAAKALLGAENVFRIDQPTMTTEDFGYFLQERPGCFYHIGAGCPHPLHSPGFLPTPRAVLTAAAVHAAVLEAAADEGAGLGIFV